MIMPLATAQQSAATPAKVHALTASAVVFDAPGELSIRSVDLMEPSEDDLIVDVCASAISTGTERLLWQGEMPPFPGMGYPLVPGYEAIGVVRKAGAATTYTAGQRVFVPGARCHQDVSSLFGAASSTIVVNAERAFAVSDALGDNALLLALAATAHHALHINPESPFSPELIIGHGVLGRLMARICMALGYPAPTVWETNPARRSTAEPYKVIDPNTDPRKDYCCCVDVSGDATILDQLIARLPLRSAAPQTPQIVLAGFYKQSLSFNFAPAFMREVGLQVAAEWLPSDLQTVHDLASSGRLSLEGLITHWAPSHDAKSAYETAFHDADCLKMAIDWRER
jgi:3-hydroxyethyl bacteriochlorophyllide a dehydrogenase